MKTYIFEATDSAFYGKFLVGLYDTEWERRPMVSGRPVPLLKQEGWWDGDMFLLQDLSSPYNGSIFGREARGYAKYDVDQKGMTVCFLYVEFLQWLRDQDKWDDLDSLPKVVTFPSPAERLKARRST